MTTTTQPTFHRLSTLRRLETHQCACPGCPGTLPAESKTYPGWRRCTTCGCHWIVSDRNGERQEGLYPSPTCPARQRKEEEPHDN